jgi:hypothetical protein
MTMRAIMIATVGVVFIVTAVALTASTASAASSEYQAFSSPATAAKRLSVVVRHDGVRLFHPCAAVNPYLIRCGGFVSGIAPLSKSGRLRIAIVWRKVNPYMLEKTLRAFGIFGGGILEHRFVDTRVAY